MLADNAFHPLEKCPEHSLNLNCVRQNSRSKSDCAERATDILNTMYTKYRSILLEIVLDIFE